ncbi:LADA_0G16666g1_1 [Lachancea dasiensis]|uniref:LADA_0G16666g1_1 n=1 Tax=Lachancea dasiensis TaxID=1072105 RepID=A0A1G4JX27_9SACH|nr:LADA_0G16666g1_1 [Lachancea dasiensis]
MSPWSGSETSTFLTSLATSTGTDGKETVETVYYVHIPLKTLESSGRAKTSEQLTHSKDSSASIGSTQIGNITTQSFSSLEGSKAIISDSGLQISSQSQSATLTESNSDSLGLNGTATSQGGTTVSLGSTVVYSSWTGTFISTYSTENMVFKGSDGKLTEQAVYYVLTPTPASLPSGSRSPSSSHFESTATSQLSLDHSIPGQTQPDSYSSIVLSSSRSTATPLSSKISTLSEVPSGGNFTEESSRSVISSEHLGSSEATSPIIIVASAWTGTVTTTYSTLTTSTRGADGKITEEAIFYILTPIVPSSLSLSGSFETSSESDTLTASLNTPSSSQSLSRSIDSSEQLSEASCNSNCLLSSQSLLSTATIALSEPTASTQDWYNTDISMSTPPSTLSVTNGGSIAGNATQSVPSESVSSSSEDTVLAPAITAGTLGWTGSVTITSTSSSLFTGSDGKYTEQNEYYILTPLLGSKSANILTTGSAFSSLSFETDKSLSTAASISNTLSSGRNAQTYSTYIYKPSSLPSSGSFVYYSNSSSSLPISATNSRPVRSGDSIFSSQNLATESSESMYSLPSGYSTLPGSSSSSIFLAGITSTSKSTGMKSNVPITSISSSYYNTAGGLSKSDNNYKPSSSSSSGFQSRDTGSIGEYASSVLPVSAKYSSTSGFSSTSIEKSFVSDITSILTQNSKTGTLGPSITSFYSSFYGSTAAFHSVSDAVSSVYASSGTFTTWSKIFYSEEATPSSGPNVMHTTSVSYTRSPSAKNSADNIVTKSDAKRGTKERSGTLTSAPVSTASSVGPNGRTTDTDASLLLTSTKSSSGKPSSYDHSTDGQGSSLAQVDVSISSKSTVISTLTVAATKQEKPSASRNDQQGLKNTETTTSAGMPMQRTEDSAHTAQISSSISNTENAQDSATFKTSSVSRQSSGISTASATTILGPTDTRIHNEVTGLSNSPVSSTGLVNEVDSNASPNKNDAGAQSSIFTPNNVSGPQATDSLESSGKFTGSLVSYFSQAAEPSILTYEGRANKLNFGLIFALPWALL